MIKTDGYSWSNKFNINTIGVPGVASMKRIYDEAPLDDNQELIEKYDTNVIEVGVIFSTLSSPFGKQKTITFQPRYIIINESGIDLVATQDDPD